MAIRRMSGNRRAGRPARVAAGNDGSVQQQGFLRKSTTWVVGLVAAAIAAVVTGALVAIPGQLVDFSGAKDAIRGGLELSITAEIVYLDDEGRSMVVPGPFEPSAYLRDLMAQDGSAASEDFIGEIRSAGGVNVGKITVRMVVEGRRNQEIRILDIRPKIVSRAAPLGGTFFNVPSQGGSPAMKMFIDFDQPYPIAREAIAEGLEVLPGEPFFSNTTISLMDREEQVIIIRAVTDKHYVAFNLEVEYRIGDETKIQTVTHGGRPFEVTSLNYNVDRSSISYRDMYQLDNGFSLCQVADPGLIRMDSWPSCGDSGR